MGKTGKWLKNFLVGGKKDHKQKDQISDHPSPTPSDSRSTPISIPKERRRWSFRRPAKEINSPEISLHGFSEPDAERKRHAMAVAVATAAAADAAVAAAQAAAAVVRLTRNSTNTATAAARTAAVEDYAAVRVQAVFRGYLARKALRALKGLVKLQALARGHLVRKQATATLRCMQALVTVQARARAQRIKMIDDTQSTPQHKLQTPNRRSPQHPRFRQSYETDRSVDENVKIVEVDLGESMNSSKSRGSYSVFRAERTDQRFSPAPSALTDISPGAFSGHFEDFSFVTAQSSPNCFSATSMPFIPMSNEYPFFPNYMANTESSRAKVRSQSAPKQRPDSGERPPSRMRPSVDGRNIPRGGVRMQRSTSHVGATVNGYQYPPSVKLDRSNVSLQESECGSTSTIMTNADYGRSLVSFEVHGSRY